MKLENMTGLEFAQANFLFHLSSLRYWLGMAGKPNGGCTSQPRTVAWHQSQAIGWASR